MNRRHLLTRTPLLGVLLATTPAQAALDAAVDWVNRARYAAANDADKALPANRRRVVFMGDSITEGWARPDLGGTFLADHGFIGRGISGQVTAQMLLRFTADVLGLQPQAVHILGGTNDIAGNAGAYNATLTQDNLTAMAGLAKAAGVKVFMGSVPPASSFGWRPDLGNRTADIKALNSWIKAFCRQESHVFVDYWPVLADGDGGLTAALGLDAVHPNQAGYRAMAPVALTHLG